MGKELRERTLVRGFGEINLSKGRNGKVRERQSEDIWVWEKKSD